MFKLNKKLRSLLGTEGEFVARKVNPPVFIIGCMRSGTTFLVDLLSSHPQLIKVGSEMNKVWEELTCAKMTSTCNYLSSDDYHPDYIYQLGCYFTDSLNKSKSLKRHLMRAKIKTERRTNRIFYDWKNIIPLNKSPHLTNKIGFVNALFPQSKIIFIIREIYGHSASMKKHFEQSLTQSGVYAYKPNDNKACWSIIDNNKVNKSRVYPGNFEIIPEMWINLNYNALLEIERLPKNNYIIVDYNDMINNQEFIFTEIFNFLHLKEKYRNEESRIAKLNVNFKNTSTKGNPLFKWKKQLSEDEKNQIENVKKINIDKYHYIIDFIEKNKIKI